MTWGSNPTGGVIKCRYCGVACRDDVGEGLSTHEQLCLRRPWNRIRVAWLGRGEARRLFDKQEELEAIERTKSERVASARTENFFIGKGFATGGPIAPAEFSDRVAESFVLATAITPAAADLHSAGCQCGGCQRTRAKIVEMMQGYASLPRPHPIDCGCPACYPQHSNYREIILD